MTKTESAVLFMISTALDDTHGYDQSGRWSPDYDCSSLVITAWKQAGVSLTCCTTRDMYQDMTVKGFRPVNPVTEELKRGDVLLNRENHTAMYIGSGQIVHASINENGGITGGQTGDQTGREICVTAYYDYPWTDVLRFTEDETETQDTPTECTVSVKPVKYNDKGHLVACMQALLQYKGYSVGRWGIDGDFGNDTYNALSNFQNDHRDMLNICQGVCDADTWQLLFD